MSVVIVLYQMSSEGTSTLALGVQIWGKSDLILWHSWTEQN